MPPASDDLATLQLAYDRLQQQYQTLAAFWGTASHELRAPINQVISLHQLVLEDLCESPEEEREFVGQANQSITRMLHHLDTLISLSKLEIGTLSPVCEPIALETVLNQVRQFTEMQCVNRQCRLSVHSGAEPLWVLSDDRWLLQALMSLVEAALAAGSTVIALERLADDLSVGEELANTQPSAQPATVLQFTCNAPAHQWPPEPLASPTMADGGVPSTLSPELSPQTSLSPGFRYHLAQRILGHLGSAVHSIPNASDGQHRLTITLPRASRSE